MRPNLITQLFYRQGALPLLAMLLLGGCASAPGMQWPRPLVPAPGEPAQQSATLEQPGVASDTRFHRIPAAPQLPRQQRRQQAVAAFAEKGELQLDIEEMPLPDAVQYVLDDLLGLNYQLDEQFAKRKETVTLRSNTPMNTEQLLAALQSMVEVHNLVVVEEEGNYKVVPRNQLSTVTPRFLRSQSMTSVPGDLRPVFQYVTLRSLDSQTLSAMLKSLAGNKVTITTATGNALLLFGMRADVGRLLEAIDMLDQPAMRGRHVSKAALTYVSADRLAQRLQTVLTSEGYTIDRGNGIGSLVVLPVAENNSLVLMAPEAALLEHMQEWVTQLDTPPQQANTDGLYVYTVRNTSAQALVTTLEQLYTTGAAGEGTVVKQKQRLIVNPATNSLIFRGEAQAFEEILRLMRELDRPARQVLVEVTIAELQFDESQATGIEWAMAQAGLGEYLVEGGTLGGLGIGSAGLNFTLLSEAGDTRALLNFLATNNQARILSTPRIIARNGEQASITVGDEVPVVTGQQTSATTGSDSILQTIQYRETGIILQVTPIIHGAGRVDLELHQEVSTARTTTTGVVNSPTISQRSITTKLSATGGSTVVLGGLMEQTDSDSLSGVPGLMNLPLVGGLFSNKSNSVRKTELLVLITPYILDEADDLKAITEVLKKGVGTMSQK
ncbi:MAG: hypothetical protein OQL08_02255 [Gammaproteobacteria bacterium]|nr:hypothetical protein [Gammaproteobacteria bacterium]